MKTSPRASLALVCALAVPACLEVDEGDPPIGTAEYIHSVRPCDKLPCPLNGPDTDGHELRELNALGLVNDANFYIEEVRDSRGRAVSLSINGSELRAYYRRELLTGRALVGLTIAVRDVRDPETTWYLRLDQWRNAMHYYVGDPAATLHSYVFKIRENRGPEEDLCSPDTSVEKYEYAHDAFVFEGDRYQRDLREVRDDSLYSGWFNIACTGSTASKLLRFRHAKVAFDGATQPTLDERQALYRAYTGYFCARDEPMTRPGVPLYFAIGDGSMGAGQDCNYDSLEAIWRADGPLCVNHYRLADEPAMAAMVEACGIPACAARMLDNDFSVYGYVATRNPGNVSCE